MENSKAADRFRTFVDFARRRLAEAGLDAAIEGARLLQVLGESGLRAVGEGRIRLPPFAVDVLRRLSGRPCEEPYEFVCAPAGPDVPARPAA
ncbi:MAG: hypothetical protein QME96_07240, partial [Myxococcota bacterium]|nr:hypothetical protein [Myxococcota bacterium]